jgi:hypothetical protein
MRAGGVRAEAHDRHHADAVAQWVSLQPTAAPGPPVSADVACRLVAPDKLMVVVAWAP